MSQRTMTTRYSRVGGAAHGQGGRVFTPPTPQQQQQRKPSSRLQQQERRTNTRTGNTPAATSRGLGRGAPGNDLNTTNENEEDYKCAGGPRGCVYQPDGHEPCDWVGCEGCSRWFHCECVDMPKEVLAYFTAQKKPYMCNPCSSDVPNLFKAKDFLKDLGSKVAEIEEQMGLCPPGWRYWKKRQTTEPTVISRRQCGNR